LFYSENLTWKPLYRNARRHLTSEVASQTESGADDAVLLDALDDADSLVDLAELVSESAAGEAVEVTAAGDGTDRQWLLVLEHLGWFGRG